MAAKAVHLEGMGLLGSFLAYELEARGIQWTWHDHENPVNAWMACTGTIFPSGDPVDQKCFATWMQWVQRPELEEFVERAEWWYCTQAPPHGAKGRPTWAVGPLKRHPVGSMHLHAQRFVKQTRRRFNERRRPRVSPNAVRIVAHGFGERLDHYVWGWAKKVRLRIGGAEGAAYSSRSAFYLRRGRFVMAYAYPVPGEPWWYAGSSLIVQKAAKPLEVEPKFATWQRHVAELSGGLVEIVEVGPYMQGWRPVPAKDDEALARWIDGSLHVRPLWHNGVRIAPALVQAVMEQLNVYAWSTA